jgi:hypothetical protein
MVFLRASMLGVEVDEEIRGGAINPVPPPPPPPPPPAATPRGDPDTVNEREKSLVFILPNISIHRI